MTEQAKVPAIRFAGFTDPWEQRKLGELFDYEQPQPYIVRGTEYDDSFPTPVLTAGQSFVLGYTNEKQGIKMASPEHPVIIFDDFTTSSHFVDFPFKVKSSAMKLLTLRDKNEDIHFAYQVLQNIAYTPVSHERHWISKFATFATLMPECKSEMQAIGHFMSNLDGLITLHQRKYDKLVVFKKSMLEKMFPKDGESVPEIRFAGFTDPWEQRKLVELYEKNDERNTFGLGAERTLSIATMTFNSEGNGADASSLPNYKVIRVGDVAFEGHSNKSFAYGRFVVNAVADGIMSPRFSCLRPKNSYPVRFWKYYIHSEQVMRDILVRATKSGTMMNELVIDDLFKQSIAVPQEAEQQAIGYFFSHLDTLITLHQRKLELLRNIKKSLLDKMFV